MSEYLDEEEQLARIKSWWDENGMSLIVAVVLVVAGILGWNWYGQHTANTAHESTALLTEYTDAAGDSDRQAQLLANTEAQFGGSAAHVFMLLDQAKQAAAAAEYEQARDLLTAAVESADDALLADLARVRLAKVQMELNLADAALGSLAAVRNEGYRALALESKGDIHAARGEVEMAHQAYQAAVDALAEGETRPFLQMKLENTKPYNGQFVQMTDNLSEALKQAGDTIDAATEQSAAAIEQVGETAVEQGEAVSAQDADPAELPTDETSEEEQTPEDAD